MGLIGAFGALWVLRDYFYRSITLILKQYLGGFAEMHTLSAVTAQNFLSNFAIRVMLLSLPLLLVAAVIGIALDASQSRLNFSVKQLKFDFKKLDFLQGIKKLISLRSLAELFKSALKVILIGYVLYTEIRNNLPNFIQLYNKEISEGLIWIFQMMVYIGIKVGAVMIGVGVLDYLYQWWNYERQIKMSRQDLKDEYKQTEGDPQVKGRIKDLQRKMARQRMMQQVPKADVIIRNPTHFAVAIKYDQKKSAAPMVIAKGKDYVALKIIETAEKNKIVITENPPLARGLYASVELGQEIPSEYYQPVAEVLAFVYNLKKGKRRR